MLFNIKSFTPRFAVVMLAMSATISVAQADDHNSGKHNAGNAKWKSECGACHVAYPPHMLSAESWGAIMLGLDKHFGSHAGLDAATANEIATFLKNNADTKKQGSLTKPILRITETRAFKSEHSEVAASVWKNPKVKSPANCGACHGQAEAGNFSEDDVKIPK